MSDRTLRELLDAVLDDPRAGLTEGSPSALDNGYPRCDRCGGEVVLRSEAGRRELLCGCGHRRPATEEDARPYLDPGRRG